MTTESTRCHTIMLVDDEENVLSALRRSLVQEGYEIELFQDPAEALRRARTHVFDLFISDYRMPSMDGISLLQAVRELQPESARLILSGYADMEALTRAINDVQIYRFISKPWEDDELRTAIRDSLAHRDRLIENRRLADELREQQS